MSKGQRQKVSNPQRPCAWVDMGHASQHLCATTLSHAQDTPQGAQAIPRVRSNRPWQPEQEARPHLALKAMQHKNRSLPNLLVSSVHTPNQPSNPRHQ
eukprot:6492418-Amphidinium_carterae.1